MHQLVCFHESPFRSGSSSAELLYLPEYSVERATISQVVWTCYVCSELFGPVNLALICCLLLITIPTVVAAGLACISPFLKLTIQALAGLLLGRWRTNRIRFSGACGIVSNNLITLCDVVYYLGK